MVMLTLPAGSIKVLMNKLLVQDTFDGFELRGCVIQSFARFDIEGAAPSAETDAAQPAKTVYCKWHRLRPYIYNIIKGNERPRFLKIIFACPADIMEDRFADAGALFVNIILDKNIGHITTGVSTKVWSPDKSTENMWDKYVMNFFRENQINFEQ